MVVRSSITSHAPRRGPFRRALNVIGGIFFGLMILGYLAIQGCHPHMGDTASLRREGERLIGKIDQFVQAHGRPPRDFSETGESLPDTPFGRWQYDADDSGFGFRVGDYYKNDGVLAW